MIKKIIIKKKKKKALNAAPPDPEFLAGFYPSAATSALPAARSVC